MVVHSWSGTDPRKWSYSSLAAIGKEFWGPLVTIPKIGVGVLVRWGQVANSLADNLGWQRRVVYCYWRRWLASSAVVVVVVV